MSALANSAVQYIGSVEYNAVPAWISNHAYTVGSLITNATNSPALGNERVFVCVVAGTSTLGVLPTLTVTKGAKTVDNGVTWQEVSGQPGVNGDTTNSPVWGASLTTLLGQIIYDSVSGALQIVTTAGTTAGSSPVFSATAGTTTVDNTTTWTSLGLASNFGAFAAPHTRILNADATNWGIGAGNINYIASDHAWTQSVAASYASGLSTASAPNQYISVSKLTVPPTAASITPGASESTTGTSAVSIIGYGYYVGITFNCGNGATQSNFNIGNGTGMLFCENCTFAMTNTGSSATILANSANLSLMLMNPTFTFAAVGQSICPAGDAIVVNMALSGTAPSILLVPQTGVSNVIIRDSDLSSITGTLFNRTNGNTGATKLLNCKLAANVAMTTGTFPRGLRSPFQLHNCDSGSQNYRFYEEGYFGTVQSETTIVNNTHPAFNGTTKLSWNVATSANCKFGLPMLLEEIAQWCALTSGSHTATIQINSSVSLTNADIWVVLEYLGSASQPLGSTISSRASQILSAPTTLPTSPDSWGGALTSQQYLQVSFSPAMAGYIKARVYVAKPSTTIYVSPVILIDGALTAGRPALLPGAGYVNETQSGNGFFIQ